MSNLELSILSAARPGDLVRFIFERRSSGAVELRIEGAPANPGDMALAYRLGLMLCELRSTGYGFDRVPQPGRSEQRTLPVDRVGAWLTVSPRSTAWPLGREAVGFATIEERPREGWIMLPALDAMAAALPASELMPLVLAAPSEVSRFEVDFTRFDMPAAVQNAVARACSHLGGPGERPTDVPLEAFLKLWLSHGTGWQVEARALVRERAPELEVAVRVLGEAVFSGPCQVREGLASCASTALDLTATVPIGWRLPLLVPVNGSRPAVAAATLYNVRLPALPKTGVLIGAAEGNPVRIPTESRDRHTYIVGATGTGKSTLLARLIADDMCRGESVILLDPHGDLFAEALSTVPGSRRGDLTIIDPQTDTPPPGMNFLDVAECARPAWRLHFVIGELLQLFEHLWDMRHAGGPMFEMYLRNAILLLGDCGVRSRSTHTLLDVVRVQPAGGQSHPDGVA